MRVSLGEPKKSLAADNFHIVSCSPAIGVTELLQRCMHVCSVFIVSSRAKQYIPVQAALVTLICIWSLFVSVQRFVPLSLLALH